MGCGAMENPTKRSKELVKATKACYNEARQEVSYETHQHDK